jgi:hypothetical protein
VFALASLLATARSEATRVRDGTLLWRFAMADQPDNERDRVVARPDIENDIERKVITS